MNGKFSERMKVVLEYVNEEALRLGDEKIGVEHLILGIIREGGGTAVRTLNTLGLEMSDLRKIIEEESIAFSVGIVSAKQIDKINILNASLLAMHKAINKLDKKPDLLIIDGNRFHSYKNINHICIVKGDMKYLSIAAASIIAKTYRDDIMKKLDIIEPHYNWRKNKGYPTKEHRNAIKTIGVSEYHRKSFQLLP